MSYSAISVAFCFAWALAAYRIDRQKYPAFRVWLWMRAAQALGTLIAGARPAEWYTLRVWWPLEALSLVCLVISLRELLPRRRASLCAIGAILAAPLWFAYPARAGLFGEFVRVRECLWIAVAVALVGNLALLAFRPIEASSDARRVWWTVGGYAVLTAFTGWPLAATQEHWAIVRSVYMAASAVCCISWAGLLPSRSAAISAAGIRGIAYPRQLGAAWGSGLACAAVPEAQPRERP